MLTCKCILTFISDLCHVNLSHVNLADVESDTFSVLVKNLETLAVAQCRLKTEHLETLLRTVSAQETKRTEDNSKHLVSLNLSNNNMSEVSNDVVSRGVCNIYRVNIGDIDVVMN